METLNIFRILFLGLKQENSPIKEGSKTVRLGNTLKNKFFSVSRVFEAVYGPWG